MCEALETIGLIILVVIVVAPIISIVRNKDWDVDDTWTMS